VWRQSLESSGGDDAARLAVVEAAELRALNRGLDSAMVVADADQGSLAARRRLLEDEAREHARMMVALEGEARRQVAADRLAAVRAQVLLDAEGTTPGLGARLLAAGLIVAGLVLAILLVVRRRLTGPLATLAETMEEVASGGERRLPLPGPPVLGSVPDGFNRMVDVLSGVRRDLERAVDRKTAALAGALGESRELNSRLRSVLEELASTQAQLVRQEKMAALGTLAGGIAHEFNNLLGGITGCAEDLLGECEDGEARETLEVITRAAFRGRTIVQGLQQFSQSRPRSPERVDVRGVVGDVIRLLGRPAASRSLTFVEDLGFTPACISADPAEIHQVVLNLFQNAVQTAPPGTEVAIRVAAAADAVILEVKDRGPGVPVSLRDRIFEPFFTTREREGGTGLGLAISHGIVQAMEGALTYEDRPGGGAVFRVVLPRCQESPA
jgi:signal transduction histidine kinase